MNRQVNTNAVLDGIHWISVPEGVEPLGCRTPGILRPRTESIEEILPTLEVHASELSKPMDRGRRGDPD